MWMTFTSYNYISYREYAPHLSYVRSIELWKNFSTEYKYDLWVFNDIRKWFDSKHNATEAQT